jgi:3-oxoacyl-[acyl-carrier protein] reductase
MALAGAGYRLAINYHSSAAAAESLVDEISGAGGEAASWRADVARRADVEVMLDGVSEHFGRLDLVVNNAAVFDHRPLLEVDDELWRRTLAVNLDGPFHVSQAAARLMMRAGSGRILNVCGTAGVSPIGAYAPYCAAKAGLDMLTRCLAQALAPTVQVNGVAPGTVLFPDGTPETERERVIAQIPGGAIGRPQDIADAVLFLAAAPDYLTGAIVTVDGGAGLGSL